jgi:bifunctional DNase/RNase
VVGNSSSGIREGAFIGTVILQGKTGAAISLDARAADALAVALSAKAPIFVARPVMDRAALTHDDLSAARPSSPSSSPSSPRPSSTMEGGIRVFVL